MKFCNENNAENVNAYDTKDLFERHARDFLRVLLEVIYVFVLSYWSLASLGYHWF